MARRATWGTPSGREAEALHAIRSLGVTHVLFDKAQFEHTALPATAIGSSAMRRCCLSLEYEDHRFALYRVREDVEMGGVPAESPGAPVSGAPTAAGRDTASAWRLSPRDMARHVCGMWKSPSIGIPGSTCSVVLPSHQVITARVAASLATAVTQ